MTLYKVQCFEHNGEPYGRYCNPYISDPPYNIDDFKDCEWASNIRQKYLEFKDMADQNTFPFQSGTIGKTYERDEVEVVSQINRGRTYGLENEDWQDTKKINPSDFQLKNKEFRQIFRLPPQPVEKEPETVHVLCEECEGSGIVKGPYGKQLCDSCYGQEPETACNDLYFEVAEIAQDNIVIQDSDRFNKPFFQTASNEKNSKLKKKYHAQVQFDALQFIRDLKRRYVITKQEASR